jgi:hypothetical protein
VVGFFGWGSANRKARTRREERGGQQESKPTGLLTNSGPTSVAAAHFKEGGSLLG